MDPTLMKFKLAQNFNPFDTQRQMLYTVPRNQVGSVTYTSRTASKHPYIHRWIETFILNLKRKYTFPHFHFAAETLQLTVNER
jgi:hypothetical protein